MKINKLNKKQKSMIARTFIWIAVISVVLSGIGAIGTDIWLASTQWLLIAAVSTLFAIYLKLA